jgi:hypothetical protein
MLEEMVKLGRIIMWMPVSAKQGTNVEEVKNWANIVLSNARSNYAK